MTRLKLEKPQLIFSFCLPTSPHLSAGVLKPFPKTSQFSAWLVSTQLKIQSSVLGSPSITSASAMVIVELDHNSCPLEEKIKIIPQ